MIEVKLDYDTRCQINKEAKQIGTLNGSLTRGRGNFCGAAGELVAHLLLGGERVGHERFSHDIVLPNGLTVDVKTGVGTTAPLPHYVVRIYAPLEQKDKLATKCDAYYFLRANHLKTTVWAVGWLFADEFVEKATFQPAGTVSPVDGRLTPNDEFVVPISELRDPREPIAR